MKVNVLLPCEIELSPGDPVILFDTRTVYGDYKGAVTTTIKRVVENDKFAYCVFKGGYPYRPLSTYNITWRKVE